MWYVLLIFLSACGVEHKQEINPEFIPYVKIFEKEAQKYNRHIVVTVDIIFSDFSNMQINTIGVCDGYKVLIRKEFWDHAKNYQKEELIMHELGHCELGLDHVTTPSIMYPNMLSGWYYLDNRDSLIKELFTGKR